MLDYDTLEKLVILSKENNEKAKEDIFTQFMPYIKSLSRKTHIFGYTREDIENECCITLLSCIKNYNPDTHRFVGYTYNALKNCVNYLLRKNLSHKIINGQDSLTFTGDLTDLNISNKEDIDDHLYETICKKKIIEFFNELSYEDKELIVFVPLRKNTLKSYALFKNISYSSASKRKYRIKKKMKDIILMDDYKL